jgi:hypothetical protein
MNYCPDQGGHEIETVDALPFGPLEEGVAFAILLFAIEMKSETTMKCQKSL